MRKAVVRLFDNKLVYIIISLIASFMLWLFVVNSVNPSQTSTLTFYVQFEGLGVLDDYNLRLASDTPDRVDIRVEASVTDIGRLEEHNQIVVDVSGIREAGEYDIGFHFAAFNTLSGGLSYAPVRASQSNTDNTIIVRVNRVTGQTMPLEATGVTAQISEEGGENYFFVGGRTSVYPEVLQIDGPEEVLAQIASLEVVAEFPLPLSETTTQTGTIRAYGYDGYPISEEDLQDVEVGQEPLHEVTVSVTVSVSMVKEVPIRPIFEYGAGANEENLSYQLSQETVLLIGDGEVLREVEYLPLSQIRLDQVGIHDIVQRDIPNPPLTEIYDGVESVEIDIQIRDVTEETFHIPAGQIFFAGQAEDVAAEVVTETLPLVIRGPAEILEELDESDISVLVNLTEYIGSIGRLIVETFTVQVGDWEPEIVGAMALPGQGIIVDLRRNG
ncbi:MAG: hypothetical protein FWE28_04075 [Oscillospiraceae bacterium]|nr:hypothetical protein [Oscillospiraceae bacterium]